MPRQYAKPLRAMLTALSMLAAVSGAAVAGPLEDAVAAHGKGDYATALRLLRPLADAGSDDAQYNLGVMYFAGNGVPPNREEAAKWDGLAAKQGHANAQYNLGVMCERGDGVPQNYGEALKWYRLAADQNNASAQHNLGVLYENGQGVAQSYAEAAKWYRLAADQSDANARNNLGSMYLK